MQPRSTPYLTVALAIGLGFTASRALQSTPAEGYPMGAVALGSNPVDMAAGSVTTTPLTVFVASSDHDFVVTDVVLSSSGSGSWSSCVDRVTLKDGTGALMGAFQLQTDRADHYSADPGSPGAVISHTFSSGLVLSASDTMTISRSATCGSVDFTISGYHAQR